MDFKLTLCLTLFLIIALQYVQADFWYNHVSPKEEELSSLDLICIPGKTVMKVEDQPVATKDVDPDDSSSEYNMRRSHMNFKTEDKSCQICVCSVTGKNEHCSARPAMNVNECIRMAYLMDKFKSNEPYSHVDSLSNRIRRDYLWHNDEIPHRGDAKCKRGQSYYSNDINANNTDISENQDIPSLLDYNDTSLCFYCVCSMGGDTVGCMSKNVWFCNQYRYIRQPNAMRDVYRYLFKQDRPTYFRSLSWRLRRTMDTGMFDLVDSVGGNTESCVPYVSEYTDCTEENKCSGCSKCECNAVGKWVCSEFHDCPDPTEVDLEKDGLLMEKDLDHAFKDLENELMVQRQTELENQRAVKGIKGHGVPEPASHEVKPSSTKNEYILDEQIVNLSDEIVSLIANDNAKYRTKEKPTYKYTEYGGFRYKRATSIDKEESKTLNKGNGTVKFHNTLDEVNEDTLKNDTASGTISVQKVASLPQVSRRTGLLVNSTSSVQIGNEDSHRNDNTVDTPTIHDDKEDLLVHSKLYHVVGNYSHETKDKELSKILVNELKGGTSELIGEKGTPVISNITFHPENDTLTAMAFIAGNLLNKLWNMEKYASKDQIDTEDLKHEKISDLVELFKEPLNKRQEMFLKNALDKLSTVVNNHENVEDISLCKNIEDIKKQLKEFNDSDLDCATDKLINKTTPSPGTAEALNKITGVLNLISKYENIQASLRSSNVKPINEVTDADKILSDDEKISLNLYGKTFETITNLLVPKAKTKKVIDSLHSGNKFSTRIDMNKKIPYFKIGNLNVTLKDKIIMDYLEHIQSNPECLLKNQKLVTPPSIEGDILLNLSEFFKIKSLSDLVRLVETEKPPTVSVFRSYDDLTAIKSEEETTTETLKKTRSEKLTDTKENLKKHLKSVFNDLTELKKTEGKGIHNDLQITDALPCLEKLFNDNIEVLETYNKDEWSKMSKTSVNQKNIPVSSVDVRIKEMFSNLRNELKIDQTRATNTNNGQRPKSAVVWERVVKNAAEKINHKTRRNMGTTSKTINEIESMLQKFEPWGSNTYKRYALFQEVPPSERLVLLKTLLADTLRYLKALDTINSSLLDITTNNKQQQQDKMTLIYKFIENSVVNLELTESVVNNLGRKKYFNKNNYNILPRKQTRTRPMREFEFATEKPKAYTSKLTRYNVVNQDKYIQAAKLNIDQIDSDKDEQSTKLTKDQVINQLIKNRIMLYIQTKEATGQTKNNWNFNIAEQILTHLEIGNFKLARELYKIFASRNKNTPKTNKYVTKNSDIIKPKIQYPSRRKAVQVEPLIDFQDSKYVQAYQDNFMQQLQNLRKLA